MKLFIGELEICCSLVLCSIAHNIASFLLLCALQFGFVITLIPETMDLLCAGHFLLTYLLLDNMKNASRTVEGRIVNLSSEGHRFAPSEGIRFDKINDQSMYVATTCSFLY